MLSRFLSFQSLSHSVFRPPRTPRNPSFSSNIRPRVVPQEWPEEDYPPYANGPGYIISSAIANFVVSEFDNHKLKVRQIPCHLFPQVITHEMAN